MSIATIQPAATTTEDSSERADVLEVLGHARYFLRNTTTGLSDEQARQRSTVSELTIGGLIKHVTHCEKQWVDFILIGRAAMEVDGKEFADWTEEDYAEFAASFVMGPDETLAGLLTDHAAVAARTDALVRTLPSLDVRQELPQAPWFSHGSWSARRVFSHITAETHQHAGHADIIRESIDGQKSMG